MPCVSCLFVFRLVLLLCVFASNMLVCRWFVLLVCRSFVSCWFVSRSFDVSCVHSKHAISSFFGTLLFGQKIETCYETKCHVFLACLFFGWFCSCVFLLQTCLFADRLFLAGLCLARLMSRVCIANMPFRYFLEHCFSNIGTQNKLACLQRVCSCLVCFSFV